MSAPTITQVQFQSGTLGVFWIGTGIGPATAMSVQLTNPSQPTQNFPAVGLFANIQPDLSHDPNFWSVAVAISPNGDFSTPVLIVTAMPQVTRVQNTGDGLFLAWNQLTGVDLFSTTLQDDQTSDTHVVQGLSDFFQGPLVGPNVAAAVRGAAAGGISTGPSLNYVPILDHQPQMIQVDYSGSDLTLNWGPVTSFNDYCGFLQQDQQTPLEQPAKGILTCAFPGQLSTASSYKTWVCVQSADGIFIGPPSIKFVPVQATPTMTRVENTTAAVELKWNHVPGFDNYVATLETQASSFTDFTQLDEFIFRVAVQGVGQNSCTVRAASLDGVSIGPPAGNFIIIVGIPSIQELDYDRALLDIKWDLVTDTVTGYLLEIDGGPQPSQFPLNTSGQQTVGANLASTTLYDALVRATNGVVFGPLSEVKHPLTAPPENPSLGFDGTHMKANWAPPNVSPLFGPITGYVVTLFADGTASETDSPTNPPQIFQSGLTNDVVFTTKVRATAPGAKGPWTEPATGPYGAVLTYAFDVQGQLASLQWGSKQLQTYSFDSAGNLQSVTLTVPVKSG